MKAFFSFFHHSLDFFFFFFSFVSRQKEKKKEKKQSKCLSLSRPPIPNSYLQFICKYHDDIKLFKYRTLSDNSDYLLHFIPIKDEGGRIK